MPRRAVVKFPASGGAIGQCQPRGCASVSGLRRPRKRMSRRSNLRQADIERALKAARNAGLTVARYEIEGEKIVIYSSDGVRHEPASDLDAWREKRNARST
jgi:hypothetical protein